MDLDYATEIKAKGEKFEPNHKPLKANRMGEYIRPTGMVSFIKRNFD